MRKLLSIILSLVFSLSLFSQKSPHGDGFAVNCMDCHNTTGWKIDIKTLSFDHGTTKFPLVGQHQSVSCKLCHTSLEFSKAGKECNSCHTDIHNQTVGPECSRCHTPVSWVVNNITEIHQRSRFPLVGAHVTADCYACHTNASSNLLLFGPLGIECIDCHQKDYAATTNPNHQAGGFSTNCTDCHNMTSISWTGAGINHNFFPLTGGHDIKNCQDCHKTPDYASTSPLCISCHLTNYNNTNNPSHTQLDFSTNCSDCHTTAPGWKPAEYREHDAKSFPIYSGKHNKGKAWDNCTQCHPNSTNYIQFTCIDCHDHNQSDMDNKHHETQGYAYNSPACLECHPTGSAEGSFNHSTSAFPLTGAHLTTDCIKCHASGYAGTSTICNSCHNTDFNKTTNPNHALINVPTTCETCHTTQPGWKPAAFPLHSNYYVIAGAHIPISSNCVSCHNGNYNATPSTCVGCHLTNFNQTTNPNHTTAQFPANCEICHSQSAWTPSNFNHNNVYPLTGAHAAIANNCNTCHKGSYINTPNTCVGCHLTNYNATTNPNHITSNFPTNCEICHSNTAWAPSNFNHNNVYPLTGAHAAIANNCFTCHQGNYITTPNTCVGCHQTNYNGSTNPNHAAISIPTTCETCHTTNPNWNPATFPIHNNYYLIAGAHVAIASNCVVCHNGNYNNTPSTCYGCHQANFNQTTNPNHVAAQFPTSCETCHSQTAWNPSTFNHNNSYPLTGGHATIANNCVACHNGNYVNPPNTCVGCHTPNYNTTTNPNHAAINIPTTCETCHTTNPNWNPATFPIHNNYYVLAGAHVAIANNCVVCHNGNYNNTPNTCYGCHQANFNQTTNPNHVTAQFPTTCETCHTQTAWIPSTFNHNNYYPLTGAHATIANNCVLCHNGNYVNTPNTCVGCHLANFNATTNPNHITSNFPTDCQICHSTTAWVPSTFNHNNVYPLTGAHATIANNCYACHQGNYVNTPNTCVGCHLPNFNATTNPNHAAINIPTTCETCHTTDPNWTPATFPIHNNYYVLAGAHIAIANNCVVCHNGNYNNTPNTCVGCHLANYNQTTNPNHAAAQFPTTCTTCHNQSAWVPATWNHDVLYFPIYSGKHNGHWNSCTDCHPNAANYAVFTCTTSCHSQSSTNSHHNGVPGYTYNSTACYNCHPTGNAGKMMNSIFRSE